MPGFSYGIMKEKTYGVFPMFAKRCKNCNESFSFYYLMKKGSFNDVVCPNCKANLKPTIVSKLAFAFVCIIPLLVIKDSSWGLIIGWIISCIFLLQPIVYQYGVRKEPGPKS